MRVGEKWWVTCDDWVNLQLSEAEKRPNEITPNRELTDAECTALDNIATDLVQVFHKAGGCLDEGHEYDEREAQIGLASNVEFEFKDCCNEECSYN